MGRTRTPAAFLAGVNREVKGDSPEVLDVGRCKRHGLEALVTQNVEQVHHARSAAFRGGAKVEGSRALALRVRRPIEVRVLGHAGHALGTIVYSANSADWDALGRKGFALGSVDSDSEWGCSDETGEECKRQGKAGNMHGGLMQNTVRSMGVLCVDNAGVARPASPYLYLMSNPGPFVQQKRVRPSCVWPETPFDL